MSSTRPYCNNVSNIVTNSQSHEIFIKPAFQSYEIWYGEGCPYLPHPFVFPFWTFFLEHLWHLSTDSTACPLWYQPSTWQQLILGSQNFNPSQLDYKIWRLFEAGGWTEFFSGLQWKLISFKLNCEKKHCTNQKIDNSSEKTLCVRCRTQQMHLNGLLLLSLTIVVF